MLESENKLIKAAQRGESEQFGKLYDHYMPQIYRFVLMKVSNKHEAEDLVHDVFVSAWQNIDSYLPKGFPFSSWLYQIARNKVIDYYRLKKPSADIEELENVLIKDDVHAEEGLDARLKLSKVLKAIKALTPEQQDVISMKFIEDLSHQEIAAALDKSEGAVRLLQHRAINSLKELLNEDDGGQTS